MTSAIKAALKAADALVPLFFALSGRNQEIVVCKACWNGTQHPSQPIRHRDTCLVGVYLAARKEIGDDRQNEDRQ